MEEIKNIKELRFAHLAPEIWEKLGQIPRTGWVTRGVENPETVQEHTISLRILANEISGSIDFTDEEKNELLDMLEIHDWPESITGDEVILMDGSEDKLKAKEEKKKREDDVMIKIVKEMGEEGKIIYELWDRFESSDDKVSDLARQLDKYQAVEKALEYEKKAGILLFKEFRDYANKYITHPILIERMKGLESSL
jgi:5'-deoxynucleotidase YfbR-like HD superfamily hydrolase